MIPRTLSATSLQVADACMARYRDEYFLRAGNIQGTAANVGIVCHGTLEDYLRGVFIKKDMVWSEAKYWELFNENFDKVFGPNRTIPEYEDAHDICQRWFYAPNRLEDLEAVKILSLESKNSFELKTSAGIIPVNYIMDRLDRIGENEYRVVDYKSNRVALNTTQLRKKLQARLYALMVQIKYKDAQKIWVQFDFLRHSPVEVLFTREDNVTMYRELQRRAENIINTPENKARETLNDECGWCVRKSSCKQLLSHVAVGGILGKTPDELADVHYQITSQSKAQAGLLSQIEDLLLTYALQENLLEFDTDNGSHVQVVAPMRRSVNSEAAGVILGSVGLARDYQRFSVTDIDRIIKQKLVTGPQAELLKATIVKKQGDPAIKVDHSGL